MFIYIYVKIESNNLYLQHKIIFRWLATPYRYGTEDPREIRYNRAHARARNSIEMTFGYIKNKFIILKDGIRMTDLANAARLIQSLFALWNYILKREGDGPDEDIDPDCEVTLRDSVSEAEQPEENQNLRQRRKRKTKDYISRKYFS